jgi:arabinofuranosyltransferase
VEGYTSFLWMLLMAIPLRLGLDPVVFSQVTGVALFAGSLLLVYRIGRQLLGDRLWALVVVVLLGTNYTFSCYATGGLETPLQTFLLSALLCLVLVELPRGLTPARLLLVSLTSAAALLTRQDSALLLVVLAPLLVHLVRSGPALRLTPARLACLAVPFAGIIGAWVCWKLAFYGSLLPNTYYLKVAGAAPYARGLIYLWTFLFSYLLLPFPLLALAFARRFRLVRHLPLACLAAFILLWCAYVIRVGGDFMEFRFIVPILPAAFLCLAYLLSRAVRQAPVRLALVALVLVGSFQHSHVYGDILQVRGLDSMDEVTTFMTRSRGNWPELGQALGRTFDHSQNVRLAVTAAGAIPFYSQLPTVDMLGLNDQWVAHHGIPIHGKPGHARLASLEYLIDRGVNLIVAHPVLVDRSADYHHRLPQDWTEYRHLTFPEASRLLFIPIDSQTELVTIYLTPSPTIDALIARQGWRVFPVPPPEPDALGAQN